MLAFIIVNYLNKEYIRVPITSTAILPQIVDLRLLCSCSNDCSSKLSDRHKVVTLLLNTHQCREQHLTTEFSGSNVNSACVLSLFLPSSGDQTQNLCMLDKSAITDYHTPGRCPVKTQFAGNIIEVAGFSNCKLCDYHQLTQCFQTSCCQ